MSSICATRSNEILNHVGHGDYGLQGWALFLNAHDKMGPGEEWGSLTYRSIISIYTRWINKTSVPNKFLQGIWKTNVVFHLEACMTSLTCYRTAVGLHISKTKICSLNKEQYRIHKWCLKGIAYISIAYRSPDTFDTKAFSQNQDK